MGSLHAEAHETVELSTSGLRCVGGASATYAVPGTDAISVCRFPGVARVQMFDERVVGTCRLEPRDGCEVPGIA